MQFKSSEYDPEIHDQFKALSVNEPHASNITKGLKQIELRTRSTSYRGQLLICSTTNRKTKEPGNSMAFVELYDVKKASELTPEEIEKCGVKNFAPYSSGFAWFLRDVKPTIQFPVKGQLGIFNLVYTKDTIIPIPSTIGWNKIAPALRDRIHEEQLRKIAPQKRRFKRQLFFTGVIVSILILMSLYWLLFD